MEQLGRLGDNYLEQIFVLISKTEKNLNHPVIYAILPEEEIKERLSNGDFFAVNVENSAGIINARWKLPSASYNLSNLKSFNEE